MRNAVKATVDAYDGTVRLYAWDEQDPILKAWRSAFPGVVQDRADIPEPLLSHLRYPEDLFKVQRYQFARYHVTDAKDFYEDNSRWEVPADPNLTSRKQPPYRLFVNPTRLEEGEDGAQVAVTSTAPEDQVFSLTSVYVPRAKNSLAAFMSVDSDATDEENFGTLRVLQLSNEDNNGPRLAANQISSDSGVRDEVLKFTQGDVRTYFGNLLTLPVGEGLMYVQPLYAARDRPRRAPCSSCWWPTARRSASARPSTRRSSTCSGERRTPRPRPTRARPPTPRIPGTRPPAACPRRSSASSTWLPRRTPRPTASRPPETPPAGRRPSRRPATTSTEPSASSTSATPSAGTPEPTEEPTATESPSG